MKSLEKTKNSLIPLPQNILQPLNIETYGQLSPAEANFDYFLFKKLEQMSQKQDAIHEDVVVIKDSLMKPQKEKRKKLPLRDAANNEILNFLLQRPKQKRERLVPWSRFRVTIVLLWATGLRVNEIRKLTRQDIDTILTTKKLVIYQSKVNDHREIYFSDGALHLLRSLDR